MADKELTKSVEEVKAYARGIHISPRKARLLADLVKSLPAGDALTQLDFTTRRAALPIKKLINSAIANARHNFQIEADRLFIKNLSVDQGQVFMRYEPRAQGRAFPVRKRTSHINLTLGVAKQAFKTKKKVEPLKREKAHDEVVAPHPLPKGEGEKKSRFAFWRRKKEQDTTQVPPKEDVKGKHYTGFDRRGKMGE